MQAHRDYHNEAERTNAQRYAAAIRAFSTRQELLAEAIDDYYNTDGNRAIKEIAQLFLARVNGLTNIDGQSVAEFETALIERIIKNYAKYTYEEVTASELEMLDEESAVERRRDECIDLELEKEA